MRRRSLLAALLALGLAACAGGRSAPPSVRAAPVGTLTPAFQGMRGILVDGARLRAASDGAALRRLGPEISRHGLGLLESGYPHDLRDADVAQFREGRAVFGDRLKAWVRAVEGTDDARLFAAFDGLLEAFWAWVDAYKGLPPERSV